LHSRAQRFLWYLLRHLPELWKTRENTFRLLQTDRMASPGEFAQTLKEQADIVRIVGEYVTLRKSGAQNFQGLCPFHQEKTPSFSVHATRQFFHCFGCGASGDVFSFVQKIENITFPEAVRLVAEKLKIPLPKVSYASPEEARAARLRGGLIDIHERACAFFQEQLRRPEAAHAREYLASRGLTPEHIAEFRIGYAPDSGFLLRDALRKQFDDEELLRESGLFSWKEKQWPVASGQWPEKDGAPHTTDDALGASVPEPANLATSHWQLATAYSKFRNRVMFPIANESGKIIAFTGRTLSTDEKAGPKYLNSPETPIYSKSRVLFNLDKAKEWIRKFDYAILVEGQMDCISVYNAGFRNVIASSGTAFTEVQARLLSRFSKNIVVNFDPDTAGAAAAERSLALLLSEEFQIRIFKLEEGFDPDLYIKHGGKDAYGTQLTDFSSSLHHNVAGLPRWGATPEEQREFSAQRTTAVEGALKHSAKYFDYLIERAHAQFPVRTPEGKVKALNFLLPHVQRVPNRIVRDELANEISHRLGIESAVLRQELRHAASSRSASRVSAASAGGLTDAERVLIRALASPETSSAPASNREGEDGVFDPARQAHFALVRERLHEGSSAQALVDVLLAAHEQGLDPMSLPLDEAGRGLLAATLISEQEELTPELLESAIKSLRRRLLLRQLEDLQHQLKEAERHRDNVSAARLLQERVKLRRAMTAMGEVAAELGGHS
jgi:DNA primase